MPTKRYRAAVNFPSLDAELQYQTVEVESNHWSASLAKIGRALRKLEVTKRRRIKNFSLVVHEAGAALSDAAQEGQPGQAEQLTIGNGDGPQNQSAQAQTEQPE